MPEDTPQRPAIRTMKSDVQELFKTAKPSFIELVEKEAARPSPFARPAAKTSASNWKLWIWGGVGILLLIGGGLFAIVKPRTPEPATKAPVIAAPPTPFFVTETSRTVTASPEDRLRIIELIEDSTKESEREGSVKRILIKLKEKEGERFAEPVDFFSFWRIVPPASLLASIKGPLMVFIHYGKAGPRLGFASRSQDPDRTFRDVLFWEPSLLRDMRPLLLGETIELPSASFEDRTYRNIDWRYLKLASSTDVGIGYTIFPARNIVVFTTGKESMEAVINRLFDAR